MTPSDFAERLAFYAARVRELRGVSRRNPHAFVEDKSELAGAMLAEASKLRAPDRPLPGEDGRSIAPESRRIRGRSVAIEVRRKAS